MLCSVGQVYTPWGKWEPADQGKPALTAEKSGYFFFKVMMAKGGDIEGFDGELK